jgi:hypothetical protein
MPIANRIAGLTDEIADRRPGASPTLRHIRLGRGFAPPTRRSCSAHKRGSKGPPQLRILPQRAVMDSPV